MINQKNIKDKNTIKSILNWAVFLIFVIDGGYILASSESSADQFNPPSGILSSQLPFSCSSDKVVASPDEYIKLKAWIALPTEKSLKSNLEFVWTVTTGTLESESLETRWYLKGVKPGGEYTATLRVKAPSDIEGECSVRVYVVESVANRSGISRSSGRSFLLPQQREKDGFGLYSYVLLGSPPRNSERELYLKVIDAYLNEIQEVEKLENYIRSRKLNITYLPVTAIPSNNEEIENLSEWILQHYDYPHARFLLSAIPGEYRDGVHIVSFLKPLSILALPPYLEMDLSNITPNLARSWVEEFIAQAAQERYWEEKSMDQFRLRVRTTVSVLALGLPEVIKSLEEVIKLIRLQDALSKGG